MNPFSTYVLYYKYTWISFVTGYLLKVSSSQKVQAYKIRLRHVKTRFHILPSFIFFIVKIEMHPFGYSLSGYHSPFLKFAIHFDPKSLLLFNTDIEKKMKCRLDKRQAWLKQKKVWDFFSFMLTILVNNVLCMHDTIKTVLHGKQKERTFPRVDITHYAHYTIIIFIYVA